MAGACAGLRDKFSPQVQGPNGFPPPILGVLFCLISVFCFICVMISFSDSLHLNLNLLLSLALVVFCVALGTRTSAWERGYPSVKLLVPIGIGTTILAMSIGIKVNVVIYTPYSLAVGGRNYDNVSPFAKSAEYMDAGIIKFTADSVLDTSRTFGFKAQDYTYCVAPVVSSTVPVHPDSSGPAISFWAVGEDCCGNRGDFRCDGAGDQEVRNAFAVKESEKDALTQLLVPRTARPMYLKAIAAAKVLHGLKSEDDDNILLVRWASDPEDILQVRHNRAVIAVVASSILYAVVITIIWTTIHLYFDREVKRGALGQSGFSAPGRLSLGNSPLNSGV